jgi:hypothetical protein
MSSQVEYYRKRMAEHDLAIKLIEDEIKTSKINITCKKRKYEEAMGYQNDYEVVQESEQYITNNIKIQGENWIDSYLENLSNQKK